MKNVSWRMLFLGILVFGIASLYGAYTWIIFYQSNIAPHALSTLRDKKLAYVVNVMVAKQPYKLVFQEIQKAYPNEETWMHFYLGHPLGEALYKKYETKAYSMCETFYNFGCYHGIITSIIRSQGQDPSILPSVKKACESGSLGIVGCVHPMGHALGVVYGADIKKALSLCDVYYPYPDIVSECWIGVIMEYSADFSEEYWVLHEGSFCDMFDEIYEPVCTRIVMRHIAKAWDFDFDRLLSRCDTYADIEVQKACSNEVGYWIGQQLYSNTPKAIETCKRRSTHKDMCLVGVARTYETTDQKMHSAIVCREIGDVGLRTECIKKVE